MKIVIDLQSCQSGSRLGGIGRYSLSLAKAMIQNGPEHDFHIILSSQMPDGMSHAKKAIEGIIGRKNIHVFKLPGPVFESDENNSFLARSSEIIRENLISNLEPDIVHVSSLVEGFGDNVTTSIGRHSPGISTAVTLYDLIPLRQQEAYLGDDAARRHYFRKLEDFKNAGLLLAISDFSRCEAIELLEVSPSQIVNISSGIDPIFGKIEIGSEQISILHTKYGINRDFLLYTGSFDQRKNHSSLIAAFARLPSDIRSKLQLVIVGNGWPGVYDQLSKLGSDLGLRGDDLIFAGKVTDEELIALYNLACLFVFPSLSEGFGLPVLEAMSCGTPVIGSNTTSIPEVIGFEKALFDPRDEKSIADKILLAITDDDFRDALIKNGLQQTRKFSWDISARIALRAFEEHYRQMGPNKKKSLTRKRAGVLLKSITEVAGARLATDEQLAKVAMSIEAGELDAASGPAVDNPKIGFITTWNTRCGIASYSRYLVENFTEQVRIFAPHAQQIEGGDGDNVCRCWDLVQSDELLILESQVLAWRTDVVVIQFNYGFFEFEALSNFLKKLSGYGIRVLVILHSTVDPVHIDTSKRLADISPALSDCAFILVHSETDMENLTGIGLENIARIPHGVPNVEKVTCLQEPTKELHLATYGFFLPNKGLLEIIEAVALIRDQGIDVRLNMLNAEYGAPESANLVSEARQLIVDRGLNSNVQVTTDYLEDSRSVAILAEADLIVFPYQATGESSSAAVRMGLASGVPVAVTPLPIFDDVSQAVYHLPGLDPSAIASGILVIRGELESRSPLSLEKGRDAALWCEHHRYSTVSKILHGFIYEALHDD